MSQQGNNSVNDFFAGLKQSAAGFSDLTAKLQGVLTPEMMASLPPEQRAQIEKDMDKLSSKGGEIANLIPEFDKAMQKASDIINKANK